MNLPNYKEARLRKAKEYKTVNYNINEKYLNKYKGKKYFIIYMKIVITMKYLKVKNILLKLMAVR